jgi:hypothetical protein
LTTGSWFGIIVKVAEVRWLSLLGGINDRGKMSDDDYEVIGDYVVFSGSFEAHVVSIDTDEIVKSFHGETAWSDGERWAWDNSKLY